jgi:ABC-type lipoprotein release transport system permease subunit
VGGIAAAAAMLGAAVTVGYSLATGFDRSASAADLPEAIASFDPLQVAQLQARLGALPNVESVSYQLEHPGEGIAAGGEHTHRGNLIGVRPGRERHGYAIVAGRDLGGGPLEAVIERGLAREWHLSPGQSLELFDPGGGRARLRIVGIAVSPETVSYPLTRGPRVYVNYSLVRAFGAFGPDEVNRALIWVNDSDRLDVTLAQARSASFGAKNLRLVTRGGIRVVVGRAAGIVIALLVAFSIVAIAAAGVLLAASASAEVQRRQTAIGVLRALGATPRAVAGAHALEAALIALPAGLLGLAVGTLAVVRPTQRLLEALNQLGPGAALAVPLAACLVGIVTVVAAASAWPAWRAASRPAVEALHGADLAGAARRSLLPSGPAGLGMRLALARPFRTGAAVVVLAASAAVVLLMLALASLLQDLRDDPGSLGKRYAVSVPAPAAAEPAIRRVPGVAQVAARYEVDAADSFELSEAFRVIAFDRDPTAFEAPELDAGRRIATVDEVEVGLGLANALNLRPGTSLAVQFPSGEERRFRVVGVVRALENDGRVAYVRPERLLEAVPWLSPVLAVRAEPGTKTGTLVERLAQAGFATEKAGGVLLRNGGFLGVLAGLLRSLAVVTGLVCLYALVQMLALTAEERRAAVAVVRACGGSPGQVAVLLGGAALLVAGLAGAAGILLERFVVGPAASSLTASYATLPLVAGAVETALVAVGLALLAAMAVAWVARSAVRAPIAAALHEE